MTSKEALNNLIEDLKWCWNDGVELTDYDKSVIEPIQKDLEILDILKPILKAVIELKGQNINVLDFHISDNAKEKIKEWLNNAI